jgi:hypothetical protein
VELTHQGQKKPESKAIGINTAIAQGRRQSFRPLMLLLCPLTFLLCPLMLLLCPLTFLLRPLTLLLRLF